MEIVKSAKLRELFISKLVIFQEKGQFGEKQLSRTTSSVLKNSSILENPQFGRVSGRCYGYCDRLCDWRIMLSALNMIG